MRDLRFHRVFWILALLSLGAAAQRADLPSMPIPHPAYSGRYKNDSAAEKLVWMHLIHVPAATWLRVRFSDYALPGGSRVELESYSDGHVQRLGRVSFATWFPGSAYLNGEAVIIRLFAGPKTDGAFVAVAEVDAGLRLAQDDICSPKDSRVPTMDPRTARILPAKRLLGNPSFVCSGFLATAAGHVITAGHCVAGAGIAEFNVPPSTTNGDIVHPSPDDQFVLLRLLGSEPSGPGCDWAVFEAGPNHKNQTPIMRQGQYFKPGVGLPPVATTLRITGHGSAALGPRHFAPKTAVGSFLSTVTQFCSRPAIRHLVDTSPGDSGSPIIDTTTGDLVGVHVAAGCRSTLWNANHGTAITNKLFRSALTSVPRPPGPLDATDLVVTDKANAEQVARIDVQTNALAPITRAIPTPYALTMAHNNVDLQVCQSSASAHRVLTVSPQGVVSTLATLGATGILNGIELDQDGTLVVSSSAGVLYRVTPTGSVTTIGSGYPGRIEAMTLDRDTGDAILASLWNLTLGSLLAVDTTTGAVKRTIATGLDQLRSVAFEPRSGNFVVTTYPLFDVRVVGRSGQVMRQWRAIGAGPVQVDDFTGDYYIGIGSQLSVFSPSGASVASYGRFWSYVYPDVERYGSRQVSGLGTATPGSTYAVSFRFHGMGGGSYVAALSTAQRPGIPLAGGMVNLAVDSLFLASLNGTFVRGFQGPLDASGRAAGSVSIPAGVPRGLRFYCAAVAVKGGTLQVANSIGVTVR